MESDILEGISLRDVGSAVAIDPSWYQTDSTKFYESFDMERNYEIFSSRAEWETRWPFYSAVDVRNWTDLRWTTDFIKNSFRELKNFSQRHVQSQSLL